MKYTIDVTFEAAGNIQFIQLIKAVRCALSIGLKEAKQVSDQMRDSVAHVRLSAEQYGCLLVAFKVHDVEIWTRIVKVHEVDPSIEFDFSR